MPTLRTSVHPPYAAYLRVYEPLAAFAEPERSYWQSYAAEGPRLRAVDEHRARLADLTAVPPLAVPEKESRDAFVHEADGVLYLCPWRTRLRSWLALAELREEIPGPLLDAAVPPVVRAQAESDWDRWRTRYPDGRPWILTSTWSIPVRWFLLFGDDEREYIPSATELAVDGPDGFPDGLPGGAAEESPADGRDARDAREVRDAREDGAGVKRRPAPVLRYRTPMAQARRRVARGFRVLRETLDAGPLVDGVEEVGRWLEEFHPRSLVELDYGGLVHAIPEQRLAGDRSAEEVAEGVAALRAGDPVRAGRCYRALTERWRRVQELQYAN
ncbi:hypothetical protein DN069_21280 [Streptacidiphilus pinicola]|uniref:DUF8083 domain-containing protein n=1 Tax=Streptacidiphilus pinicola TaxID=2219663 RepID=A0A2X0K333_9ACTN|nr:hypothetical protein [Streptacidiphilus pinicola]RAG83685.1 hypothetical protein DN069_21280 [Streptacidiphilus pinicola]